MLSYAIRYTWVFNEDDYDVSPIAMKHEGSNFALQINIFQTWRRDIYIADSPSTTPLTGLTAFIPYSKERGEHI